MQSRVALTGLCRSLRRARTMLLAPGCQICNSAGGARAPSGALPAIAGRLQPVGQHSASLRPSLAASQPAQQQHRLYAAQTLVRGPSRHARSLGRPRRAGCSPQVQEADAQALAAVLLPLPQVLQREELVHD